MGAARLVEGKVAVPAAFPFCLAAGRVFRRVRLGVGRIGPGWVVGVGGSD